MREAAIPSIFLSEVPPDLIEEEIPLSGGTSLRRDKHLERLTRIGRTSVSNTFLANQDSPNNSVRRRHSGPYPGKSWAVGDQVMHSIFGQGKVTHVFGSGEKISIAIKFEGMSPKILDPRLAPLKSINDI